MVFRFSIWILVFALLCCLTSNSIAATVEGHSYKTGQSDHSNITILFDSVTNVPAIGLIGIVLLLLTFSLFCFVKKNKLSHIAMISIGILGFSCVTYAFVSYSTMTASSGFWSISNVTPGMYNLSASATGYETEILSGVEVIEGSNSLPDIWLNPVGTPIPAGSLVSVDPIIGNMRYVPSGSFVQGSPETEACRFTNEAQFTHTLTRSISVMETEVSRQMWADLRLAQPSLIADPSEEFASPTLNHPVQQLNWYMTVLYANLLSVQNGYERCYYKDDLFSIPVDATNYYGLPIYCDFDADGYRLATEGEWEYFCRAGTTGPFSCDEPLFDGTVCYCAIELTTLNLYAYFCRDVSDPIETIGSKLPNPWNIKDAHGNIGEWCWDLFGDYPGDSTDYSGLDSSDRRIVRGGEWDEGARFVRSAFRGPYYPYSRVLVGFRLVRTLSSTGTPIPTWTPSPTITPTPTVTQSPSPTPTSTPTGMLAGELFSTDPIVGNLRYVPNGVFVQGSPEGEACRDPSLETQFIHTLTRNIAVMETEVTRQMWAELRTLQTTLPLDPSDTGVSPALSHPVQNSSWYLAVLYANLASVQNSLSPCYFKDTSFSIPVDASNYSGDPIYCNFNAQGYRLATEGEWEYACRGATTSAFSCNEPNYTAVNCGSCEPGFFPTLEMHCVFCSNDPGSTEPAGSKLANPWNIQDVHGNISEWCWDWFDYPYPVQGTDYSGIENGQHRVFRGGSIADDSVHCRAASRDAITPNSSSLLLGFRLVRTVS